MKTKVIIKPIGANDTMLPGIYHIDGKVRVLLSEFTFKDYTTYEYEKEKPKELSYTFSKKGMPTKEYEYELDTEKQTSQDKSIEAIVLLFWGQHPQFTVNGVATKWTKVVGFDLLSMVDKTLLDHKTWLKKLTAANRVHNMTASDKRDVAYFFGISPIGKTEQELTLILADLTNGHCLDTSITGTEKSKLDTFLNTWLKETDEERLYIVNTNKAITFGIFMNTIKDGRDNYYYGQTFVGNSFNDVLAFCKREGRIYSDSIVREINIKEGKEAKKEAKEATKSATPTTVPAATTTAVDPNIEKLRNEIRQLVKDNIVPPVKGLHLMSVEKMTAFIAESKKEKPVTAE